MDVEAVSEPDAGQARDELRELGLRYVSDGIRGIMRRRAGNGFSYRAPDGSLVEGPGYPDLDPQPGNPAGLAGGVDLALPPRPSPGHGP